MLFPFAAAVTVPAVQVVIALGVAVFCKPVTYESEKVTPVRASFRFGLVIVKVSVEVPPARIGLGANNLVIIGGARTVREEVAIPLDPLLVPPSLDETKLLTLL
jgi:hypothetical protein